MLPVDGPSTPDETAAVAARDELERAFRRIPVDQRAVFVLHHYLGLPLVEIAEMLEIPAGTARSRLYYATQGLRAVLVGDAELELEEGRLGMTDDRSLERAARSWLESGPTEAPDRAVEAALLRIQTTRQDRVIPVLWRLPTMNAFGRLFAGLATVALVAVVGLVALRPGGGPGAPVASPSPSVSPAPSAASTPSPSPTPAVAACALLTSQEVRTFSGNPGLGAVASGSGSGAETDCRFVTGGGDIIVRLTYTKPGGAAAFAAVKARPGVQVVDGLGSGAVFDPAIGTLYVTSGDALVAIVSGSASDAESARLSGETTLGEAPGRPPVGTTGRRTWPSTPAGSRKGATPASLPFDGLR